MMDDLRTALGDMLRDVATFIPKALAFIAILVIGFIAAKLIAKAVNKTLERVGFDRAVERGGLKNTLQRSRYDASDIVAKLAYYAIVLFTLQLGFGVFGPNPVSDLLSSVIAWLPQAFVAVVIVVVAAAIANAVRDIVGNTLSGLSYGRAIGTAAWAFILALGGIAALNQIGVATTVTTPVLIAVLATVGGVIVVGAGGGLVKPMQSRWDRWLNRAERDVDQVSGQSEAYRAGAQDATEELRKVSDEPERRTTMPGAEQSTRR